MLSMITDNVTTLLIGCVVFLILWLIGRRPRGLPPGPFVRVPLVGYWSFAKRDFIETIRHLREKYGDIYHVYLGRQLSIVFSGYDLIKDAMIKQGEMFSERPTVKNLDDYGMGKGIIFNSGPEWKELRKFSLEALREFGFGRNILQEKIGEEIMCFLGALEENDGKPFDIQENLTKAVSNIISNIVFGKRFQYNDSNYQKYLHCMDTYSKSGGPKAFLQGTFLRKLPGDITGYKESMRCLKVLRDELVETEFKEHEASFRPDTIECFLDAYIKAMKDKKERGENTAINTEHLWRVVLDLFLAGSETTTTTLRWALLYLLCFPDIQDRLYKELEEHCGKERLPRMEDRSELPFFNAFILEVLRYSNIAPLSVPHSVPEDVVFRGYRIPKGCTVIPNMDSVLRDPQVFKAPDTFRPERFLQDGKVVKPEQLIPFFFGRRVCLGESLAKMELFLFLTAMVQRFRFESPENQGPLDLKGIIGGTRAPRPFLITAIPRM